VFSDEHGDYAAGSYLRNPPGTAHAPRSADGCTIFVKLWQFAPGDTETVRIDSRVAAWRPGQVEGLTVLPLHEHGGVTTLLERWAPGTRVPAHTHPGGEEILVLEGSLRDEDGDYPPLTWLRNPRGSRHAPSAGPAGALVYQKTGHIGARWLALPST
jgi:anti-sigma factor ChrR (cupin superfamily)